MSFFTISVRQLAIYAHHGVFAEEKVLGQRFLLDIQLRVHAPEALIHDDIVRSVSYAHVIEEAKNAFTEHSYNMIETAADRLATHLLTRFDKATSVSISVHKPSAPIAAHFESICATVDKTREDLGV
jgi:dihydroneopterin aldolase